MREGPPTPELARVTNRSPSDENLEVTDELVANLDATLAGINAARDALDQYIRETFPLAGNTDRNP
jgi:hypothetical protein